MRDSRQCFAGAMQRRHLGLVLKLLERRFRRRFEVNARAAGLDDVTIAHGRILGFLQHAGDRDIFQRDIETEFGINRSTVTAVLQVMEKNGLIARCGVPGDSRLKKVTLTLLGTQMHQRVISIIDLTEQQTCAGLTEEQLTAFLKTAEIIEQNLT